MDDCLFALGFERWTTSLPWQTSMYVHSYAARDGARLYLAVPRSAPAADPAAEQEQLARTVESFFRKHGGRQPVPAVEYLSSLA
jgi:hypothetical protein